MGDQITSFYMENGAASSTAEIQQNENPSSAASIRSKRLTQPRVKTESRAEEYARDNANQAAMLSSVKRGPAEEDSGYSSSDNDQKQKAKRSRSNVKGSASQPKAPKTSAKGESISKYAPRFTPMEDQLIMELHAKHNGNFNAIGAEFNELRGRPVNKIKQRFTYLMKKQQKGSSKEK
ncbi:hypothetical protein HDU88_002606 [Geranomyces variabilis]|nr:hypothetical protein HDU88_002606 [Geranomyces variabilis]